MFAPASEQVAVTVTDPTNTPPAFESVGEGATPGSDTPL
jgi:hypothetical protein